MNLRREHTFIAAETTSLAARTKRSAVSIFAICEWLRLRKTSATKVTIESAAATTRRSLHWELAFELLAEFVEFLVVLDLIVDQKLGQRNIFLSSGEDKLDEIGLNKFII